MRGTFSTTSHVRYMPGTALFFKAYSRNEMSGSSFPESQVVGWCIYFLHV